MHNDKHVVKMILEYAQLLSTAHRLNNNNNEILYKVTHINHPCSVWVRSSQKNYIWLSNLLNCLCKEYTFRYEKIHKVEYSGLLNYLLTNIPSIELENFTDPPQAMPDFCKVKNNTVLAYRNYYLKEKVHLAVWKKRNRPEWFRCIS